MHSISVEFDEPGGVIFGSERSRDDEANSILRYDVRNPTPIARLRSAVRRQFHAECRAVIVGRLARISHVEFEVINSVERQEICRRGRVFFGESLHQIPPCAKTLTNIERLAGKHAFNPRSVFTLCRQRPSWLYGNPARPPVAARCAERTSPHSDLDDAETRRLQSSRQIFQFPAKL